MVLFGWFLVLFFSGGLVVFAFWVGGLFCFVRVFLFPLSPFLILILLSLYVRRCGGFFYTKMKAEYLIRRKKKLLSLVQLSC